MNFTMVSDKGKVVTLEYSGTNQSTGQKKQLNMTERSGLKQVAKVTLYAMGLLILFVQFSFGKSVNVGKSGSQGKILKKYIEPTELKKLVENPVDSIWIIDVRSEKAYANGHIPTARSFPAGTVVSRLNEIPKSQYLIIYCTVGANAQIVSHKLKKAGYKRYINWGGISRWQWEKETYNSSPGK